MLYSIVLVSAKHQHESSIGIHMSHLSWVSLPPLLPSQPCRFLQSPGLSSLSHTTNSHWLSILHMVMNVSMLLWFENFWSTSKFPMLFLYARWFRLMKNSHELIWECKEWKPIMKGFISTKLSLEIYLDKVKLFFNYTKMWAYFYYYTFYIVL